MNKEAIATLNAKEQDMLLSLLNSGISWRLQSGSRKSEVQTIKSIKEKLQLSNESVMTAMRNERRE